ncbi:MAG: hypothetical protein QM770_20585 [Tepidisphaeraceae bacterium]
MTKAGDKLTLYVDGGNGTFTTVSKTARLSSDVVFGALQHNANYYNGDIAEIRMYSGPMNSTVAYNISSGLATTYGITTVTAPTNQTGAAVTGTWTADTLNSAADGSSVTSWSSSVGTRNATAPGGARRFARTSSTVTRSYGSIRLMAHSTTCASSPRTTRSRTWSTSASRSSSAPRSPATATPQTGGPTRV